MSQLQSDSSILNPTQKMLKIENSLCDVIKQPYHLIGDSVSRKYLILNLRMIPTYCSKSCVILVETIL